MTPKINLKKLRELAERVTQDPWSSGDHYIPAFIAAANPVTLIALLDYIEKANAALAYCSQSDPMASEPDNKYDFASAEDWKMMRARATLVEWKERFK